MIVIVQITVLAGKQDVMDIIKEADKFLYGLLLNAAKGVKDNYHRRQFKGFNRELVSVFAGNLGEAERDAGDPVLIELNASPGDHAQRVCGRPLFGDMTDWVLEDYFKNRSMDNNQLSGSWCTNKNINKICG